MLDLFYLHLYASYLGCAPLFTNNLYAVGSPIHMDSTVEADALVYLYIPEVAYQHKDYIQDWHNAQSYFLNLNVLTVDLDKSGHRDTDIFLTFPFLSSSY